MLVAVIVKIIITFKIIICVAIYYHFECFRNECSAISLDRMVVRRATADDYEAIVRISKDIYDGLDYLPRIYFRLLEHPNRCVHVAEWDGEIVSVHSQERT